MQKTFEAVYENGVLRPLEALDLPNQQHVRVTIASEPACDASVYFNPDEWEASKQDDVQLGRGAAGVIVNSRLAVGGCRFLAA